jgi:hypothetical protein
VVSHTASGRSEHCQLSVIGRPSVLWQDLPCGPRAVHSVCGCSRAGVNTFAALPAVCTPVATKKSSISVRDAHRIRKVAARYAVSELAAYARRCDGNREFTVFDVPQLSGLEYTREGLVVAEQEILRRFAGSSPWSEENWAL